MSTHFDANSQLKKNNSDPVAQSKYAQIIESLMYLMNFTRPDIAYVVCRLSRYSLDPNNEHWSALARLIKYLRGTMNYGILYSEFPSTLEGYNAANWISDSYETKSTGSFVFTLGGGAISWKSARLTIESERRHVATRHAEDLVRKSIKLISDRQQENGQPASEVFSEYGVFSRFDIQT
nr:secreted RxLR effector protein 161-like [Nicotiana tomentosiformis]